MKIILVCKKFVLVCMKKNLKVTLDIRGLQIRAKKACEMFILLIWVTLKITLDIFELQTKKKEKGYRCFSFLENLAVDIIKSCTFVVWGTHILFSLTTTGLDHFCLSLYEIQFELTSKYYAQV